MKRVRITYPGAFHHAMNGGYYGNNIFAGNQNKARFLEFLEGTAKNAINVCTFARTPPLFSWLKIKREKNPSCFFAAKMRIPGPGLLYFIFLFIYGIIEYQ
jgi:hypothetical protein